jgi:hypothetical protein
MHFGFISIPFGWNGTENIRNGGILRPLVVPQGSLGSNDLAEISLKLFIFHLFIFSLWVDYVKLFCLRFSIWVIVN